MGDSTQTALTAARAYIADDRDALIDRCTINGDLATLDPLDADAVADADRVLALIDAALAQ